MAKTASMKLIELMILKEDIDSVLEFLGKKGNFQFQNLPKENIHNTQNPSGEIFQKILEIKNYLGIGEIDSYSPDSKNPTNEDFSTIFYWNIFLSLILYAVLLCISPPKSRCCCAVFFWVWP